MKNASASLLFLASLAAVPAVSIAQITAPAQASQPAAAHPLTGTVADSLTHQALPFATVVLQSAAGSVLSTISNE